jgi:Ribbon-helix-helix domain
MKAYTLAATPPVKKPLQRTCHLKYSHVITSGGSVPKMQSRSKGKAPTRKGKPLTVYFSDAQTVQLNDLSRRRRVPKSELLRIAVDLLVDQINGGQLHLPLGIEIQKPASLPGGSE